MDHIDFVFIGSTYHHLVYYFIVDHVDNLSIIPSTISTYFHNYPFL